MYPTAETITAPQAALLLIIAKNNVDSKTKIIDSHDFCCFLRNKGISDDVFLKLKYDLTYVVIESLLGLSKLQHERGLL